MHLRHGLLSIRAISRVQPSPIYVVVSNHTKRSHSESSPIARTTTPSSSRPTSLGLRKWHPDEGFLAFTKTSLYKLTLPLASPDSTVSHSLPLSFVKTTGKNDGTEEASNLSEELEAESEGDDAPWEQKVETGKRPVAKSRVQTDASSEEQAQERSKVHSVVFLLHSGQPLSYIASLIRAEEPEGLLEDDNSSHARKFKTKRSEDPTGSPPITFHLRNDDGKRWSPSTGVGDFMREAARVSSFVIRVGNRSISVNVPSFEDRTRFMRATLHAKTREIEHLARLKDTCDKEARAATHRLAIGAAGMLGVWWASVGYLTFHTDLGWDTMEPITYLTGLGTAIAGYVWFLWHNREVSYRAVLMETTSNRQQKLYSLRGFNIEHYQDLIEDAKALRKDIKRVAWDYDLTWDQGDTDAGKHSKRALQIVRKVEAREKRKAPQEEDGDEEEDSEIDNDADGKPDGKAKAS